MALPIAVFARTHSALAVGIAASMQGATTLIFGLFAGALADRLRHRPVLIVTDLVRAAVLGAVAVMAISTPTYPVEALYAAGRSLLGAFGILHDASAGAALPLVVSGRDLLRANGRLSASESAGNAGGPALAGALTSISIGLAFAVDGVSFLLSAFGVGRVRALLQADHPRSSNRGSIGSDIREGLRALCADADVMHAVVLATAMNVMAVTVEAQFIPYARNVIHVGQLQSDCILRWAERRGVVTALVLGRSERTRGDVMILGVAAFGQGVRGRGRPSKLTVFFTYLAAGASAKCFVITHWSSLRQRRFRSDSSDG